MSTSVSKTGNTSSQRSCTVVPSPPSKGGCVSCPPDTICCLFMVLSTSAKHVVACLRCVSFCVRNDIQPFEKCHFCCSPGSQLPPPLAAHGGRSTDCPAGLQELGCGSRPNSSETIASCSSVHSSGAVLCPQLQPEWGSATPVLCGTVGPLVVRPLHRLELWQPAGTDLGTRPPLLLCPQEQRFSEGLQTSQRPK